MPRKLTPDQARIVRTLDRPLFVAAGAGSGKSSTLAERVAYALSPGSGEGRAPYLSGLDEVLVITFTHAAAEEIKEKIRARLREGGLEAQALAVDSAWISTIHGMCSRILRGHAFELGLDPGFEVLDESASRQMVEEATEEVLARIREEGSYPGLRAEFDLRGRAGDDGPSTVFGMVARLRDAAASALEGFDSIEFPGAAPDLAGELRALSEQVGRALALGRSCKAFGSKTGAKEEAALVASEDALEGFLSAPPGARDARLAREAMAQVARPNGNAYRKADMREVGADLRSAWEDARLACAFATAGPLSRDVVEVARAVEERYARAKREAGALDNDDLLALTLRAFRDHPDLAGEMGRRFRLVMVDEFQDTNAQQVRMIELLSGRDACHLVTVGDAQQSIYRFRAADVSVFRDRGAALGEGSTVRLDRNFRSHADVLSFVDRVLGRGLIPGFMSLEPCETRADGYAAKGEPRIDVELVSASGKGVDAAARSAVMADAVSDRIRSYVDAGVSPDDCVLLLGRMARVGLYLDALRARGLDCVVTGGSTFSATEEVACVAALLHLLACPRDTASGLFPVLAGDMFRLDADDLCALSTTSREGGGGLDKRPLDEGLWDLDLLPGVRPSERLLRAREVLARAVSRVGSWGVGEVLLACVRESGWLARLEAAGADGVAKAANVLAAIRYADDLASARGVGVARASREFDLWLESAKVGPASLVGGGKGAVRVMTVHASKGLEFPLVAVAECWGSEGSSGVAGVTCENRAGRVLATMVPPGVSAADLAVAPADASECESVSDWARLICSESREGDQDELARLLYVAITRAREACVLGLPVRVGSKGQLKTRLAEGVVDALFDGALPPAGVGRCDYGGSEPARVRHVALSVPEGADEVELDCAGAWDPARYVVAREEGAGFDLVDEAPEDGLALARRRARRLGARRGTFSYSSLRALGAPVPPALAREMADPGAGAAPEPVAASLAAPDAPRAPARPAMRDALAPEGEDDPTGEPEVADPDRATSLGTAFHVLAQAMVECAGELPPERVRAQERLQGLSRAQCARLEAALARWAASDVRAEALSWDVVRAEVPFFVRVPGAGGAEFVEGAIDLLCSDRAGRRALVVDYKTGDADLAREEAWARHEMQASLYAGVLSELGFEDVTCAFVCVERECADGGPLVCRYAPLVQGA
ncbi:MAG: UvrD-helicase domain-containing protein [Olsenella sp.]|jgi:ATP-dependent helicase/nuclease subunit A